PYLSDALIAKNYLSEQELRSLGQLVSGYLDFAERQAERRQVMTMQDWASHLDTILTASGETILKGAGSISHEKAVSKAEIEYKKYQAKTLSDVEKSFLEVVKGIQKQIE
ncbi:MAG: RhuM family protein, partial [Bacteroides sp.]